MRHVLDAHVHSRFSDGELEIEEIARIGEEKGYCMGVSDHAGSTYALNNDDKISRYLSVLDRYPVLKSLELNINERFALPASILQRVDYVVGGVHFQGEQFLGIPELSTANVEEFVDKAVSLIRKACSERRMDILSHPTCLPRSVEDRAKELFGEDRMAAIIETAVKNDIALEINNYFTVPYKSFLQKALEMGATFSLGSDGHSRETVGDLSYPLMMTEELGIRDDHIFTPEQKPGGIVNAKR